MLSLPKIFKARTIILAMVFILLFLFIGKPVFAQQQVSTPAATLAPQTPSDGIDNTAGQWQEDSEVTFVGKTGARSGDFLDWALRNYSWLCVQKISENQCDNSNNPLVDFWIIIRNIVYALIALFVLATAFIMIITRGQNITIMRFIPRFVFIVVLITLSFSLVQFIYQVADIIQGFFLRIEDATGASHIITTQDLLYIGFDYESFKGYKVQGDQYAESAFISLLLVRLTAITYYVMTGILLIRKIILWFFIIISPIFPLLIFYRPIRNTAKIWVGEFFRWLLYAPLFAIFLHGLVVVWKSQSSIPLAFDYSAVGSVVYPTAVNILLGGPGQSIFYRSAAESNSVNLADTFALYVVALLMLWVVILLPFLLLKIFLDYIATLSIGNNVMFQKFMTKTSTILNPKGPAPAPTPPPPSQPTGAARALPFMTHKGAATIPVKADIQANVRADVNVRESADVLKLANLSIPKMRDIAKYETSLMSKDVSKRNEVSNFHSNLSKIANPSTAIVSSEKEKFSTVREKLVEQKQKGNQVASSVLAASQISANAKVAARQGITHATVAEAKLPTVNKVQQVSLEDYEEVRKLWTENYQTVEPPKGLSGELMDRKQWIKNDIDKITQAIALLNSPEQDKINEGMNMVSNILPFLLIGGFSKSEVVAYLKAKMEAGRQVLTESEKREQEEESMVARETKKTEEPKEATMSAAEEIMERNEAAQNEPKDESSGNK